ncbi:MAG: AAA family ATPase [Candidatus Nanohalobium sp.]
MSEAVAKESTVEEKEEVGEGSTKINKVTCKGFKSFQQKTAVPFYEGLTAIVGDNGNGKSNVLDGISFVFGRRSSKIRAEKMTQLIFNGGDSRKPADYAKVTVTLDNTSGIFDEFLENEGEMIGILDVMIAAIAVTSSATVLTYDSDFRKLKEFSGFNCEVLENTA